MEVTGNQSRQQGPPYSTSGSSWTSRDPDRRTFLLRREHLEAPEGRLSSRRIHPPSLRLPQGTDLKTLIASSADPTTKMVEAFEDVPDELRRHMQVTVLGGSCPVGHARIRGFRGTLKPPYHVAMLSVPTVHRFESHPMRYSWSRGFEPYSHYPEQ